MYGGCAVKRSLTRIYMSSAVTWCHLIQRSCSNNNPNLNVVDGRGAPIINPRCEGRRPIDLVDRFLGCDAGTTRQLFAD